MLNDSETSHRHREEVRRDDLQAMEVKPFFSHRLLRPSRVCCKRPCVLNYFSQSNRFLIMEIFPAHCRRKG